MGCLVVGRLLLVVLRWLLLLLRACTVAAVGAVGAVVSVGEHVGTLLAIGDGWGEGGQGVLGVGVREAVEGGAGNNPKISKHRPPISMRAGSRNSPRADSKRGYMEKKAYTMRMRVEYVSCPFSTQNRRMLFFADLRMLVEYTPRLYSKQNNGKECCRIRFMPFLRPTHKRLRVQGQGVAAMGVGVYRAYRGSGWDRAGRGDSV